MWKLIQSFYSGLYEHNRQMVDASCNGSFLYKTPEEAWELFEHLSEN